MFELTNAERAKYNIGALSYNQKLQDAAYKKAQNMFNGNYWAHYGPGGETPWDFIISSGYSYEFAGENLAKNFLSSQNVTDAWMNSETHKENILRKDFTEIGFAVVNGVLNGEQTTLVVQMFGKPSGGEPQLAQGQPPKNEAINQKYQPEVRSSVNKIPVTNKKQVLNLQIPLSIVYLFIVFLIVVFAIDYYVGSKLNLTQIHGKHIAHFVFLSSVVVGVFFFLSKGAIL